MGGCNRLFIALFTVILLSLSVNAQEIKYSMGPKCSGTQIICGLNEIPVCLFLESGIHLVSSRENDLEENKKYIPSCKQESIPTCADENSGLLAPDNIVLECVEFVQCQDNEVYCSDGKIAKCLGDNNELNGCNCADGSNPICDYTWQVSNVGSYN